MNIPIKALNELSQKYGYDHIIVFATKEKMQYVATYGRTIEECDQAAQFGDKMKDGLGWPESLHAAPSRVRALQKRVKELEAQLKKAVQMNVYTDDEFCQKEREELIAKWGENHYIVKHFDRRRAEADIWRAQHIMSSGEQISGLTIDGDTLPPIR